MNIDEFQLKSLSVQFVIGGRSYDGWDCWGLVFCAYRDVFGIQLKNHSHDYDPKLTYGEISDLINRDKPEWNSIASPIVGDVGLYRVGKYETHVALVVPGGRMLHCEQRAGTICEPLNNLIWGRRNVGYFRHA